MALYVIDKWDSHTVESDRGDEYAALDLLKQRVDDGFWYDNWDEDGDPETQYEDRATKIVETEDAHAALSFLLERSDFEYEYVEVKPVRRVP